MNHQIATRCLGTTSDLVFAPLCSEASALKAVCCHSLPITWLLNYSGVRYAIERTLISTTRSSETPACELMSFAHAVDEAPSH